MIRWREDPAAPHGHAGGFGTRGEESCKVVWVLARKSSFVIRNRRFEKFWGGWSKGAHEEAWLHSFRRAWSC